MKENILDYFNTLNAFNIGEVIFKIVLAYIFLIWIAVIFWTYRDINNRTKSIALKSLSILSVALFNIFGLIIYLIIRPTRTLVEKSIEEGELAILIKNEIQKKNAKKKIIRNKKRLIAKGQ